MGQLQTICSMKLNTAIFRMYYLSFVHLTYDIEDIDASFVINLITQNIMKTLHTITLMYM